MVPVETVTNEALKPKDIEYLSYPEAADREEQIAQAEASAMLMSKFAFWFFAAFYFSTDILQRRCFVLRTFRSCERTAVCRHNCVITEIGFF